MPAEDFLYISPGIYTNEIDLSQPNDLAGPIGPVIIGRFPKGPGMTPTTVNSYKDFVALYGYPEDGGGGSDWREGNHSSPTYAAYAAKAWLANSRPATIIRLLGEESSKQEAGTRAGWITSNITASNTLARNGAAWGLFLISSASLTGGPGFSGTGSLAAVWYLNQGAIALSGTIMSGSGRNNYTETTASANCFIKVPAGEPTIRIIDSTGGSVKNDIKVSFNPNAKNFIREAFNTDPVLLNTTVTADDLQEKYFLGQSYENHLPGSNTGDYFGVMLPLQTGTINVADHEGKVAQSARSGWLISQDVSTNNAVYQASNMQKLFRFQSLNGDGWGQENIKISIENVRISPNASANPWGTFNVLIRKFADTDSNPAILESFTNLSLNPNSSNYIARVIGDQYSTWDEDEKRFRTRGDFVNNSGYVRMEMFTDLLDSALLPFGFEGPTRFRKFTMTRHTGSGIEADAANSLTSRFKFGAGANATSYSVVGDINTAVTGNILPEGYVWPKVTGLPSGRPTYMGPGINTASFEFPKLTMRTSGSDANGPIEPKNAYFGMITKTANAPVLNDFAIKDIVRTKPDGVPDFTATEANGLEISSYFSLDDIRTSSLGEAYYQSGSRLAGNSLTAVSSSYEGVLASNIRKFTLPLYGGFDGLSILEKEPFNNTDMADTTVTNNYAFYSIAKAIDMLTHPEDINANLALVPGITEDTLTKRLLDRCTDRGDMLGIIDLEGGYLPPSETSDRTSLSTYGSVTTTVTNIKLRAFDTSYGCAYYPWVQIVDGTKNTPVWLPPSVAALGVMSNSQNVSELWFAPAGFNRGGLNSKAGLQYIGVREKLSADDRDDLYEVNINPIASFPSEGIVVFGQKTLQATPSALDRINVRRLLIYVKSEISRLASKILFDQNVDATWNRFLSEADPFLASIKAGLGLEDYKLILDKTTTTPDLVDRNALYAKIVLKPAKAIEFILLDFVITNTGVEFND